MPGVFPSLGTRNIARRIKKKDKLLTRYDFFIFYAVITSSKAEEGIRMFRLIKTLTYIFI
jgi:hypothetical protein